ncbi:hypothetical protein [Haloarchaeobius sp. TZWWS8]|uniref:hypothetical protein n=1 Tax=Haloarchaeobius sp. TZWWS8 TaxID=3446121 RepID=UPI003EBB4AE5
MSDRSRETRDPGSPDLDFQTVGRVFAAVSGLLGVVFVASPLFLLQTAAADPGAAPVARIVQGTAVGYGFCLLAIAWVGRHGQRALATVAPALLGVVLLVAGPVTNFELGLDVFSWTGLALASVFVAGLPAIWVAYRDRPVE